MCCGLEQQDSKSARYSQQCTNSSGSATGVKIPYNHSSEVHVRPLYASAMRLCLLYSYRPVLGSQFHTCIIFPKVLLCQLKLVLIMGCELVGLSSRSAGNDKT